MAAYYNEIDPYAAEWLRNLIKAGHIADGVVDERSIADVVASDLDGFTQCHFFAGIGVWSLALRRAGWADDRPVWTGSCPCQPFSAAGKGTAFADERHLWPHFHWLIEQCRPPVVFGEQVASKDAEPWLDLVSTDLEALGFAVGAVAFPSAGVGAPHIRDRTYWMADAGGNGCFEARGGIAASGRDGIVGNGATRRLGNTDLPRLEGLGRGHQAEGGRIGAAGSVAEAGESGGVADAANACAGEERLQRIGQQRLHQEGGCSAGDAGAQQRAESASDLEPSAGPTNGHWRDADWLLCRDGKWRPVEASPQPLADGSAESLGRVRAEVIAEIEKEINASTMEREIRSAETLRALRCALRAQASRVWTPGRIPGLHEAPFLLAFLRQLTEQGWGIEKGVSLSCAQTSCGQLRSVRHDIGVASASCERGLEGQPTRELADAVHFLSSLLARHAHSAWGDAYAAYAEIGFPLGHNAPARVGRLRGYGNAINAEAAQAFIEVAMESLNAKP